MQAGRLILDEKGIAMAVIARILGLSLLTAGLGIGLGYAFFGHYHDWSFAGFILACVSGIVGAIAGAAREIVTNRHQPPPS